MLTDDELFALAVKCYEIDADDKHELSVGQAEIRVCLLESLRPFLLLYGNAIQKGKIQ